MNEFSPIPRGRIHQISVSTTSNFLYPLQFYFYNLLKTYVLIICILLCYVSASRIIVYFKDSLGCLRIPDIGMKPPVPTYARNKNSPNFKIPFPLQVTFTVYLYCHVYIHISLSFQTKHGPYNWLLGQERLFPLAPYPARCPIFRHSNYCEVYTHFPTISNTRPLRPISICSIQTLNWKIIWNGQNPTDAYHNMPRALLIYIHKYLFALRNSHYSKVLPF